MKKKQNLIIAFLAVFLLIGLGLFFLKDGEKAKEDSAGRPSPTPSVSIFEQYGEPEIEIEIFSSKDKGKLLVKKIPEVFKKIEYDITYQTDFEGGVLEKGITSGVAIEIPSSRSLERDLVFGTESCTTERCNFHADKLNLDYPVTVILKLYDDQDRVWELEKEIEVEKEGRVFRGNST